MYWQRLGSTTLTAWRAAANERSALRAQTLRLADCVRRRELCDAWRAWRGYTQRRSDLRLAASAFAAARHRAALHAVWRQWRVRVAYLRQQIAAVVHANTVYLCGAFRAWRRQAQSAQRSLATLSVAERVMQLTAARGPRRASAAQVFRAWRGAMRVRTGP